MTERTSPQAPPRAVEPPGGRAQRGAPESPPDFFGTLLDQQTARTAIAEGQQKKGRDSVSGNAPEAKPKQADCDAPAPASAEDAQAAAQVQAQAVVETAPVPTLPVAEAPLTVQVAPVAEALVAAETAAPAAPTAQAVPAAVTAPVAATPTTPTVEAPATPVVEADAAVPAPQVTQQQPAQPAAAVAATTTDTDAQQVQPVNGQPEGQPVAQPTGQPAGTDRTAGQQQNGRPGDQPAQQQQTDGKPTAEQKDARAEAVLRSADPVRAAQSAATTRTAAPEATSNATAQQSVAPTAPAAQPAHVEQAPVQAPRVEAVEQRPGVRLAQAVESVQAVLRVANSRGISHARLALNPAELGGIEIHLRSTGQGLVASVSADSHEAAQLLQQAGGELRRTLESQGLNVSRLDIGLTSDERRQNRAFAGSAGEGQRNRSQDGRGDVDGIDAAADQTSETTLRLPNGVLVDVIA